MLELLKTIGRAEQGTRALVAEPFDAIDGGNGGIKRLPIGTRLEILSANGASLSAVADLGDRLVRVYIFVEQYHCLALR